MNLFKWFKDDRIDLRCLEKLDIENKNLDELVEYLSQNSTRISPWAGNRIVLLILKLMNKEINTLKIKNRKTG